MTVKKILVMLVFLGVLGGAVCYAGQPFLIGTSYKELLSTPDQSGMLDRIVRETFARMGIEVDIPYIPTERSIVNANGGLLDGELNRIAGMEKAYPDLIRVPESNMTMEFVAFTKKGTQIQVSGWESLRSLEIGMVKGWKILEWNTKGFPHITRVHSAEDLFSMLEKERIDVALYARLTGYAMLKTLDMRDITVLEPPLASREMFLYLHKSHADLVSGVAEALRSVKQDGTWQKIVDETMAEYRPE